MSEAIACKGCRIGEFNREVEGMERVGLEERKRKGGGEGGGVPWQRPAALSVAHPVDRHPHRPSCSSGSA